MIEKITLFLFLKWSYILEVLLENSSIYTIKTQLINN